jgi:probable phosphoglycerate mutase
LLFVRHGNTFAPGDKVVWVGRETDLPLVDSGRRQAEAAAAALARRGWRPDMVFAAGLRRTQDFAAIVCARLDLPPPVIDRRLDELDYGAWAGLSSDEISAAAPDARALLAAWQQADRWPPDGLWRSREDAVLRDLAAFAGDRLAAGGATQPLVVSSNGCLRFLPRLLLHRAQHRASFKMRTGHFGVIERDADQCHLRGWDLSADAL